MHPYYKDATELILGYMRDEYKDQFHAYIEGDPGDIPESLLPCILVSLAHSKSKPSATGTQEMTEDVLIQVVLNKKDDFGAAKSYPLVDMTLRRLRILVQGRDESTARFLDGSICGILSKNITLGDNVLQMELETAYPLAERANGMLTQEAHISVHLRERIVVLNRQ